MPSFNRVFALGHLTRDVELKYLPNGTALASFGLAMNEKFTQGNDLKERVTFIDVKVFGKQAEPCAEYLRKGSTALVEGKLQQDRWETEDGQKRSKHEIVAQSVTFLDKKGGGDEGSH